MFEEYQEVNEQVDSKFTIGMMVYFAISCVLIILFMKLLNYAYDERPRSHVGSDVLNVFLLFINTPFILFGVTMVVYRKYIKKSPTKWWFRLTLFAAFPYWFGIITSFFPAIIDLLFK